VFRVHGRSGRGAKLPRRRRAPVPSLRALCCLALPLVCGAALQGQATPSPEQIAAELGYDLSQPLTLEQCLAIAVRVHPDIRLAAAGLDQAAASLRQARSALWPTFQASTDYQVTEQPKRTVVIGGAVIPVGGGRSTTRNTQVDGTYAFYEPSRFPAIRQAEVSRQAAVAGVEDAKRQLAYLVTQAYYDQLAADRLVAVQEASVAAAQGHVNQVQARIDAGDAAPVEIHAVRAQLLQAQLELSSARTQAATTRASLSAALGRPEAAVTLADSWEQPSSLPDLDESVEAALANRPDLARREALVRAARLGVKLARIEQRPRFNVVGSGEYGRHNGEQGPSWSVLGSLQQTLFDGGATKAAVQQAEANVRAAEAQLDGLQQDVRLEVESAWLRLRHSAEAIAAAEAARDEAHAALDAAETRYSANAGIVLEITDAQVNAADADVGVVRAYYDYNVALADLQRALGLKP